MEKVCAVISVHGGGIGLAGSQENYSPKVSSSPEGYIKSNSRVCIEIAIYRPADENRQRGGTRFTEGLVTGGGGSPGHSETRVGALAEGCCCPLSPAPPLPTQPAWNRCSAGDGKGGRGRGLALC